ncbi:MAG: glycosyl transferase [Mucilaginibacter sp.]|nr:glycosyl transferase [Mucilaginibacter sp.]
MLISIIIPTYKRLEILKETYDHLIGAINGIIAEIIIVNDDKTTSVLEIVAFLNINTYNTIVVNNRNYGAASARNLGAQLATSKILLFIDDDIIVDANTLLNVLYLHEKFDRALSTPLWEYSELVKKLLTKTTFGRYKLAYDYAPIRGKIEYKIPGENKLYEVESLASFCLSIKASHYKELNGMDENFPYAGCEDQDFAERAKNLGFTLILDENIIVKHNEIDRIKKKNWLTRQFNGVQGFVFLCQKFPERKVTAMWTENIPVQKKDSQKLKIKKIAKFLIRQKLPLLLFNLIVTTCEKACLPQILLFKLYTVQAGIYLNKGFTKSYNKNAHSSHNG